MKKGKTLTELATELDRQQDAKRDFVADSRKLYMNPENGELEIDFGTGATERLDGPEIESFPIEQNAHRQLATWTGIPTKYYDRMPNDLKAVNVNHWLKNEPGNRMVRTLDGKTRAFIDRKSVV